MTAVEWWQAPAPRRPVSARLRWSVAAVVVLAVHGGIIWLALHRPEDQPPAPASAPALLMDLAPAPAPDAPQQDLAPGPQVTESHPAPTPDPVTPPDPTAQPQQSLAPSPEAPVEPAPDMPTLPDTPPDMPPPPPSPEQNDAALPPPMARPPVRPEHEKTETREVTQKSPPKVEAAKQKPDKSTRPEVAQSSAPPASQSVQSKAASSPSAGASAQQSQALAQWRDRLMRHLNRFKRYPAGAQGDGTAVIAFTLDRSGQVLSARLVKSSGDVILDQAAVALPRRANPVPKPPEDVGSGATIPLTVAIQFGR